MKKFFDEKLIKFIIVGIINTAVSAAVMFLLYNTAHFGYWGSSAVSYVVGSVISFFLNRNFTFKNNGSILKSALKFAANIAVCYVIAYSLAKPAVNAVLSQSGLSASAVEQISMVFGMILFTAINYVGQRFVVFAAKDKEKKDESR